MDRPWIIDQILLSTPSYRVPLFIFISGYLCKPRNKELSVMRGFIFLFKRKFRTLMIPYFFFSAVGLLHGMVVGKGIGTMLWQVFYDGSSCYGATPMFFVALLFVVSITFTWFTWYDGLSKMPFLMMIVIGLILLWLLIKDVEVLLPWHLKTLPYGGAFFLMGYITSSVTKSLKNYMVDWSKK